jgi:transcriptional regulator with XRE-family HTH domain
MEAVAPWLRQLRVSEGLTQAEAGARVGVHSKTVERWEAGKHEPPASELAAYVRALGGEVRELLRRLVGAEDLPDLGPTAEERELLERVQHLSPAHRRALAQYLQAIAEETGQP